MVRIEPALLFVQLVTFGLAVFLLWRFFWKPLARFMEKRARGIEQDLDNAKKSREQSVELEAEFKARLARIDEEARAILRRAAEESKQVGEQMLNDAKAEARRLVQNASRQIAEEKAKTVRDLRAETVALSLLIAEKVMKQSVDRKLQERLVDEFTKELGNG